jgi:LCP family protein required for cell wall assembly
VVLVPLVLLVAVLAYAALAFQRLPRAEVADVLSPPSGSGTNVLVVGTDSREGIDPDDPNAGAFLGDTVTGLRTDSIMVLRTDATGQHLLSIPRDLWVTDPATGQPGRINATIQEGPANLVRAVQALGIPVHRYLEIDFVGFGALVDAVGGIDVTFPYPARDTYSGLVVPAAGTVRLDGTQALAYVRSRYYEELVDGSWRLDPRSDLGRVERQRAFLGALVGGITDSRNPIELARVSSALGEGLRVDDAMTLLDAVRLGLDLRGFDPAAESLPVVGRRTSGGADVLELRQPDAGAVIGRYAS